MFGILTEVATKIAEYKQGGFDKPKDRFEAFATLENLYDEAEKFIDENFELAFNTLSLNDGSDNGNQLLVLLEEYLGRGKT